MTQPPLNAPAQNGRRLRVVLVEDRTLRRRAAEARVGALPELVIHACYPRVDEALRSLRTHRVDTVLVGDHLLDDQALEALRVARHSSRLRLVAMAPRPVAEENLLAGTPLDAVVHLETDPILLACALCGERRGPCPLAKLTGRERSVTALRVRGKSLKAIAAELGCAISSVNTHLRRARAKLGATSFADFVTRCRSLRL